MSGGKDLAIINRAGRLYARMQTAISRCYTVDDCAAVAKQADAIAAYFKQIQDDESVRRFLAVKLRAWRRIGEIFLTVDLTDCDTQVAHSRRVKAAFPDDAAVAAMADSAVYSALRIARLPADFFDQEVNRQRSISSMLYAYEAVLKQEWETSPEGQKELARRQRETEERRKTDAEVYGKWQAQEEEKRAAAEQTKQDLAALQMARDEVGYTMHRRDRQQMKEVVFLIKKEIYEVLRQAAFDQHTTMQAVLRAGLAMWLVANGYPIDLKDMDLRSKLQPPLQPSRPRGRPRRTAVDQMTA